MKVQCAPRVPNHKLVALHADDVQYVCAKNAHLLHPAVTAILHHPHYVEPGWHLKSILGHLESILGECAP